MMEFWNQFIFVPIGGFIVVWFGAMFLFAEVLVKGRYIFGIFGFTLISLYFLAHFHEGMALWMGVTFIIGILLVVIDGKFIGDGTFGVIGLIVMLISLALPSPSFFYGAVVVSAFILGTFGALIFPKFFPKRELWSKITLTEALTSEKGYSSLSEEYRQLQGKEGVAKTDFRPTGTIEIEGKLYSAVSQGKWIKKGSELKVSEVTGTRILVQAIHKVDEL